MQIQIYLSAATQAHFGISPKEIQSDSASPLTSDWKALWRCEHLISTDDSLEHLFLFTNAVTHYSLIMVDRSRDFQSLLGSFQQHFFLALHEHGSPFPRKEIDIDFQLLTGATPALTERMHFLADLSIELLLTNEINIEATEQRINHFENLSYPISPSESMSSHISPRAQGSKADILPFCKKAAAK